MCVEKKGGGGEEEEKPRRVILCRMKLGIISREKNDSTR